MQVCGREDVCCTIIFLLAHGTHVGTRTFTFSVMHAACTPGQGHTLISGAAILSVRAVKVA